MNPEELLQNTIENLIANIPQMIVVVLTVIYYLRGIKKKTIKFPAEVQAVGTTIEASFNKAKTALVDSFTSAKGEIQEITKGAILEIKTTVFDNMEKMSNTLLGYEKELSEYKNTLKTSISQNNTIVRQNLVYMDVITALVGGDPQKVKEGIAWINCK